MTRRTLVGALAVAPLAKPAIIRAQTVSAPIKIGLLSDVGGPYRDVGGPGSKIAAEGALRLAPRDRAPGRTGSEITAHRRVLLLAEGLYANLDGLSPITLQAYRDRLDPRLQGSSRQLGPGVDRNSVSRASTRV